MIVHRIFIGLVLSIAFGWNACHAATHRVTPTGSIQSAIDAAEPGDRIEVEPGAYQEALTITTASVSVVGISDRGDRPILDLEHAALEGIRVQADGVTVSGFVVKNAIASGAVVYAASDVTLTDIRAEANGHLGIHVANARNATIDRCTVHGHASAGIALAGTSRAVVSHSDSFDNLAGLRIENSDNFVLDSNTVSGNTTGIAILSVSSGDAVTQYGRAFYNRVVDNNRPNTADPGGVDAAMIPGVGLYIVAADHVECGYNRFERNGTYAAITLSMPNSALPGRDDFPRDPNTDHLYVHHNVYVDNGNAPSDALQRALPGQPPGDLYWDETGERNQWQETGEFRTVPEKLVQKQGGAHTNVIHFL